MTDSVADSRSDFVNKDEEGQAVNFALYTSPLPAQCTLVNSTVTWVSQCTRQLTARLGVCHTGLFAYSSVNEHAPE